MENAPWGQIYMKKFTTCVDLMSRVGARAVETCNKVACVTQGVNKVNGGGDPSCCNPCHPVKHPTPATQGEGEMGCSHPPHQLR